MEGLILPSISRSPPTISLKQDNHSDASLKFIKSKISLNRTLESPYPEREKRILDAYIDSLAKRGRLREAIAALDSVSSRGSKVTPKTFINLIDSCIALNSLDLGLQLHKRLDLLSEDDPFVETKLVSMYAKCGNLGKARKVFDQMRERNLYTWSAVIGAFSRARKWSEVVDLFFLMMEDDILPDEFLFQKILPACGNCGNFEVGKLIHSIVLRCGMHHDIRLNNSILAVYAKCGDVFSVRRFFDKMDEKDVVSWNSLITAYCQNGDVKEARQLMDSMYANCVEPGLVTWNILITSLNRYGNCDQAMELIKEMESFGIIPDIVTWTSMISGLGQNNRESQALDLFGEIFSSGMEPNEITLMSTISAAASVKKLRKGKELHSISVKTGFADDVLVGNALIDMYSKCGKLDYARSIFDLIVDKDAYTWNSMIGGYYQAGYCGKAHELFIKMQESDIVPNIITWNTMITGFLENGDEDQALDIFSRMGKRDTASWNALIAGYLQTGQKDKALKLFKQMQSLNVRPNSVTILSTLPACATLLAVKKVKEIHCCVVRRNLGTDLSVLNSLIDTYAKSGEIDYSRTLFEFSKRKDFITWNAMITGYVLHGYPNSALDVYKQMEKTGLKPNRGTFVSLIAACGLAGYVEEGKQAFFRMTPEYNILPCSEHYVAMIDLFGRSGRIEEAINFIQETDVEPDFSILSALLTAYRINGNIKLATTAAERLLEMEPENPSVRQCVSQAHSLHDITSHDSLILRKPNRLNENLLTHGLSWVEVGNVVHVFAAGDQSRLNSKILHSWVKTMVSEMRMFDYRGLTIEEEEKEVSCGIHSEKIAIAFAMNECRTSNKKVIRVVKDTRMCGDCHGFVKSISRLYGFEIFLKDSKCLHHFSGGCCSCGDYW
ncbi:pentatricopeptide repeat-containing protein At1g19720 [Impatiens glandulifera]|uniref:pentatricopeptide repeat-containing protein At1g19720 n=1 Tax=Impatiens glandulifera TaxID=253017 RepID=UPI001FB15071|nr:pentatricopeptide repeat-containing protein At1g19720 [Impatiens glandulifera]